MARSSSFPNRINKETSNVESSIEHEEDDGLSSSQKKNISDREGKQFFNHIFNTGNIPQQLFLINNNNQNSQHNKTI